MNLPASFMRSLTKINGYDEDAFIRVHEVAEEFTSVRINPGKIHADKLSLTALSIGEVVLWSSNSFYLTERPSFTLDPLFHAGTYYVQEASSMFLEQALKQTTDLTQPLLVLDLCAAPGGKSTLLQSIISNESLLVSNEVIQSRVNILKENIIKWGQPNVVVTNNDPKDFTKLSGLFDVMVVDAPCSGSGLFRRNPEAIREWSEVNVQLCSQRQQRILADAWNCLKEDGVLIYSTCSYSAEEDEEILDWIMKNFKVKTERLRIENEWKIDEVQTETGAYGYRFWPYKIKGEGFFTAVFRKKEETGDLKIKTSTQEVPSKKQVEIVSAWIDSAAQLSFILQGQHIAVVPPQWNQHIQFLMRQLKVRYAGVELGIIAKNDLVPEHALALSTIISKNLYAIELNEKDALNYLRRNEIAVETLHKGWALTKFKGFSLGWLKLLGNRVNNYYPKEWRILM